jgi:hypothetical protein
MEQNAMPARERNKERKLTPIIQDALSDLVGDGDIQCTESSTQDVNILVVLPLDHFGGNVVDVALFCDGKCKIFELSRQASIVCLCVVCGGFGEDVQE